ncbi:MAG: hypothetical protein GXX99_01025 [Clostridiales bacterium]|nr:hypothetical protein [Clostridiales bacterium]
MTIKKRTLIRILSYSLALAAMLGGTALFQIRMGQAYQLLMENSYRRALSDVTRSLDEMEEGFHAGLVMSSPEQVGTAALKLVSASAGGKAALDCLPIADDSLSAISLYLSQIGEYAGTLAKEAVTKKALSSESRETLNQLMAYNKRLQELLGQVEQLASEGEALMPVVSGGLFDRQRWQSPSASYATAAAPAAGNGLLSRLGGKAQAAPSVTSLMADGLPEGAPTLMYDGRYSAHMLEAPAYAYAVDAAETSAEDAKAIAAEFLGLSPSAMTTGGETSGNLPTHLFSYGDVAIQVSSLGGQVVSMTNGREVGDAVLSVEEAHEVTKDFLASKGYQGMTRVSHSVADNVLTSEYAFEDKEVLYYPDSLSVSVALDKGDVVGFSAEKYLKSHTERPAGASPKLTTESAEGHMPEGHSFGSARYAVIASDGGIENRALEITSTCEDCTYLYYLDAMSGQEMKLSRLIEDESGQRIQ